MDRESGFEIGEDFNRKITTCREELEAWVIH